ncbi:glycosyltransferase family 2 protein [Olivibacter sitiensis]|uniref:glycosyltransferase family 2 protein n=1 Tax=Olivibacter sitiensis TaxID=376470 RepID=UPI00048871D7|nr:glycosyltransferase [Olivibacter sitiensis]
MEVGKDLFFDRVTLLITHYNRPHSLLRLLQQFDALQMSFAEIIIADDGSKPENLHMIDLLCDNKKVRILTTTHNKGLGHNINKGQDAVRTPYTLYVQEDFLPTPLFRKEFAVAISLLEQDHSIDIARFFAYFKYPCLTPYKADFQLMLFKPYSFLSSYRKFYAYSDHPHLRRKDFFSRFGRYVEGERGDKTEYKMMMSFLKNKGKGIAYVDHQALFEQCNTEEEPSTMKRSGLRNSPNLFIACIRHIYRHIKFNLDYFF